MTCSEPNCGADAVAKGLCRLCYGRQWRAAHPAHAKRWRETNPDRVEAHNATRRPERKCRDCDAPVGKRVRLCADCRTAVTKRAATERHRNREAARQIGKLRAAEKPGYGKSPSVRSPKTRELHIGTEVRFPECCALLLAVAHDPCAYCGGSCEAIDHIDSRASGGELSIENVTSACQSCNSRKHSRPLLGFLLTERIDEELEPLIAERRVAWML